MLTSLGETLILIAVRFCHSWFTASPHIQHAGSTRICRQHCPLLDNYCYTWYTILDLIVNRSMRAAAETQVLKWCTITWNNTEPRSETAKEICDTYNNCDAKTKDNLQKPACFAFATLLANVVCVVSSMTCAIKFWCKNSKSASTNG
jgi:hypothetical protein